MHQATKKARKHRGQAGVHLPREETLAEGQRQARETAQRRGRGGEGRRGMSAKEKQVQNDDPLKEP